MTMSQSIWRLTMLCDNQVARPEARAAHGLAILVEADGRRILFDTGPDKTAALNAAAFGVPLQPLDAVVLSHGHCDHTGGLEAVLRSAGPLPVIAHSSLSAQACRPEGERGGRYIGPPLALVDYEAMGARFEWHDAPLTLTRSLMTTGAISDGSSGLVGWWRRAGQTPGGGHELALLVLLEGRSVVLTGCAHSGVVKTVQQARQVAEGRVPHVVLGGLHLGPVPETEIRQAAVRLHALGVGTVVPCHCTGQRAAAILRESFLGQVLEIGAGSVIEFDREGALSISSPAHANA